MMIEQLYAIVSIDNCYLSKIYTYPPFWEFNQSREKAAMIKSLAKAKSIVNLINKNDLLKNRNVRIVELCESARS